jgi:hypothetical protein
LIQVIKPLGKAQPLNVVKTLTRTSPPSLSRQRRDYGEAGRNPAKRGTSAVLFQTATTSIRAVTARAEALACQAPL